MQKNVFASKLWCNERSRVHYLAEVYRYTKIYAYMDDAFPYKEANICVLHTQTIYVASHSFLNMEKKAKH